MERPGRPPLNQPRGYAGQQVTPIGTIFTNSIHGLRLIRKKGRYKISDQNSARLTRRIGSTTYIVTVHLSEKGRETMEDKIIRLVQNEAANIGHGKFMTEGADAPGGAAC